MADRQGRLEDRPEKIEAQAFPFKFQRVDIEALLDGLAAGDDPFIVRYEVRGAKFIQIVNFSEHQNPHPREAQSSIPPCRSKAMPRHEQGNAKDMPSRAESPSLNPESPLLNPDSTLPRGAFESVWGLYPRKIGKEAAARHFKAQVKTAEDFARIQKALSNFIADVRKKATAEEYIPHGSTWFNHQWKDWASYSGKQLPPAPREPYVPKLPAWNPPDPTAKDIKDMHDAKVKNMGGCRTKDCAFCLVPKEVAK